MDSTEIARIRDRALVLAIQFHHDQDSLTPNARLSTQMEVESTADSFAAFLLKGARR